MAEPNPRSPEQRLPLIRATPGSFRCALPLPSARARHRPSAFPPCSERRRARARTADAMATRWVGVAAVPSADARSRAGARPAGWSFSVARQRRGWGHGRVLQPPPVRGRPAALLRAAPCRYSDRCAVLVPRTGSARSCAWKRRSRALLCAQRWYALARATRCCGGAACVRRLASALCALLSCSLLPRAPPRRRARSQCCALRTAVACHPGVLRRGALAQSAAAGVEAARQVRGYAARARTPTPSTASTRRTGAPRAVT